MRTGLPLGLMDELCELIAGCAQSGEDGNVIKSLRRPGSEKSI
jgi:hypothetical protein